MNSRKILFGILFVVIVLSPFGSFVVGLQTPQTNTTIHKDSNPEQFSRQKISSEEENIDSFDVNPKSGRWNVTETGTTDDQIVEGNLRLITTENTTGSSNEYFMERGLQKTDSKIEYRYKSVMDNQSQVEYFRNLGDSADFEEDKDDWNDLSNGVTSLSNGILTISRNADDSAWGTIFEGETSISTRVYHTLIIEAKANSGMGQTNTLNFQFVSLNGTADIAVITNVLSTEWTKFTFDLTSDGDWYANPLITSIRIYSTDRGVPVGGTRSFSLKYVKLIGDLDYATHVEGEVEDTWDWEGSKDFAYDVEGDAWNFDEDLDTWTGQACTATQVESNYLKCDKTGGALLRIQSGNFPLSIATSTYRYFTMEFNVTGNNVDNIVVCADSSCSIPVGQDNTGWSPSDGWNLLAIDLGLNSSWTGTVTQLVVEFNLPNTTDIQIFVNMVYLYDTELGDKEGFTGYTTEGTHAYTYVQPEGYLVSRKLSASAGWGAIRTAESLSIDSSVFDTLIVRGKSSTATTIQIYDVGLNYITNMAFTTSFQTFTIDLGADSDWSGIETRLNFRDAGTTDANLYTFDYILLLSSEEQSQSFTVGFWDEDNQQSLANVTHNLWNSSLFRWEIELYDANQEIASYYYSNNYTVVDEYYRVKVSYNILESEFGIVVSGDNESRIFRADFGDEFTTINNNPALFAFENNPKIFLSNYVQFFGSLETWIDFILSPFKEREWEQVYTPNDIDWVSDSPFFAESDSAIASGTNSTYRITVPFLDYVSGTLNYNVTLQLGLIGFAYTNISFALYGVFPSNGSLYPLAKIELAYYFDTINSNNYVYFSIYSGSSFSTLERQISFCGKSVTCSSPSTSVDDLEKLLFAELAFNFGLHTERSEIAVTGAGNFDNATEIPLSYTTSLPTSLSQEFVLETFYYMEFGDSSPTFLSIAGFAFIEREIFADIANFFSPIGDIGNIVGDLVAMILRPIILLFRWLGGMLTLGFGAVILLLRVALEGALKTLEVAVVAAIDALQPFLTAITAAVDNLQSFLTAIKDAVTNLEAFLTIISDAVEALEPFLTLIEDAVKALEPFLTAIKDAVDALVTWLSDILDSLTALAADIWTALVAAVSPVLDAFLALLIDVVNAIIDIMVTAWALFFDAIFDFIDNTGNLKATVNGFWTNIPTLVSDIISMFNTFASIIPYFIIALVFFIFTLPFLMAREPNGRVNVFHASSGVFNNSFRGIRTPYVGILGNNIQFTIPLVLIVYLLLKLAIAAGTFPDIFAGLPI